MVKSRTDSYRHCDYVSPAVWHDVLPHGRSIKKSIMAGYAEVRAYGLITATVIALVITGVMMITAYKKERRKRNERTKDI